MMENKFAKNLTEINFERNYNKEETITIKKGISAMSMDDKWNIQFHEGVLNFYRSWTGRGIFKIEFDTSNQELSVKKAFVETEFSQHEGIDICTKRLNWLIERLILGREIEFPRKEN